MAEKNYKPLRWVSAEGPSRVVNSRYGLLYEVVSVCVLCVPELNPGNGILLHLGTSAWTRKEKTERERDVRAFWFWCGRLCVRFFRVCRCCHWCVCALVFVSPQWRVVGLDIQSTPASSVVGVYTRQWWPLLSLDCIVRAMVRAAPSLTHGARRANFPQRKKITAVAYIFANEVLVFWLLNFRTLSGRSPTTLSRTCQAPPYVARVPATAAVGVGALKKTLLCDTVANSMGWGLVARA